MHLQRKGYSIIERNYRCSCGELDLVAYHKESKTLVFVEVKSRKRGGPVNPEEALTKAQANRIKRCAEAFLAETSVSYAEVRFDLIAVELSADGTPLNTVHIEDAF
ncbi:YraN family protein [Thermovibrio ammonificans]|uniref:YraN family protein n=1 Tax=Thermovibrio ammonificans TaxID=228745 RepID=UPI001E3940D1|nr:YraN family protein [Thermovibrio ammonificans]